MVMAPMRGRDQQVFRVSDSARNRVACRPTVIEEERRKRQRLVRRIGQAIADANALEVQSLRRRHGRLDLVDVGGDRRTVLASVRLSKDVERIRQVLGVQLAQEHAQQLVQLLGHRGLVRDLAATIDCRVSDATWVVDEQLSSNPTPRVSASRRREGPVAQRTK